MKDCALINSAEIQLSPSNFTRAARLVQALFFTMVEEPYSTVNIDSIALMHFSIISFELCN